ncbi:digestive organ expansion factor [Trichuris trichiura]|uniref:Digestive organ expansion factor n=1 Tax=Trichuris trichiura TaxID=36087 RepID=A0A077ZGD0_TRITR|nr:digestive organ expansion factor [Trichuris trichiura]
MGENRKRGKRPRVDSSEPMQEEADEGSSNSDGADVVRTKVKDPFMSHFYDCHEAEFLENLVASRRTASEFEPLLLPTVGPVLARGINARTLHTAGLNKFYIKKALRKHLQLSNDASEADSSLKKLNLTLLQKDILSIICGYHDMFYARRTHAQSDELHTVIAIHALNHILKTRTIIMRHKDRTPKCTESLDEVEQRDLGLTRPRILLLVPFRHSAYLVVKAMIGLLFGNDQKPFVTHKKRFIEHYGPPAKVDSSDRQEFHMRKGRQPAPIDFKELFKGNHDDCFRIGLGMAKKSLKLFVDFYSSDMIIASPLGLRMALGAPSEKHFDCDYLSSIEVLIMDQADVFLMQNWKHVIHIIDSMHRQPKQDHGVDYSKVRMWSINGLAKYYCQTIIFSSITTPEIQTAFLRHAHNYAGCVIAEPLQASKDGCLGQIVVRLPQRFTRFVPENTVEESDVRFRFFLENVLPHYTELSQMSHTLLYVPSYFDFVRIRNHLKKDNWSFMHISEYSSPKKVAAARSLFYHGEKSLLLMTERFYFYHRYVMRGAHNLLFYQLPTYANFYAELCNMVIDKKRQPSEDFRPTCAVIYSRFDESRLTAVVGANRAKQMLCSESVTHLVVTDE